MSYHLRVSAFEADGSDSPIKPMIHPVTEHLQTIFDLLRNGTNTQLILVKENGVRIVYELPAKIDRTD